MSDDREPPSDDRPWPGDCVSGVPTGNRRRYGAGDDTDAEIPPPLTIEHVGAEAIFAPLPPIEWLCERLRLARGQGVTGFGGYGFVGKTIVAQAIGLSIATGKDIFGVLGCRRGRVLHLDYEQGSRITHERYQRLARGMGVSVDDVADRLRLAVFPSVYLDSPEADDVLARTLEGFDLVIVDSLRAAAPSLEENSSDVRRVIDMLARHSERTGALPLLLLHARKPDRLANGKPGEMAGDARFSLRGSSAIFDALANVFAIGGQKGGPARVTHEKERLYGTLLGDFGFRIEDVPRERDPRWGLRVVHMEPEQLAARGDDEGGTKQQALVDRILAYLGGHGGTFDGSKTALGKVVGGNTQDFYAAFSVAESSGRITYDDKAKRVALPASRPLPAAPGEVSEALPASSPLRGGSGVSRVRVSGSAVPDADMLRPLSGTERRALIAREGWPERRAKSARAILAAEPSPGTEAPAATEGSAS